MNIFHNTASQLRGLMETRPSGSRKGFVHVVLVDCIDIPACVRKYWLAVCVSNSRGARAVVTRSLTGPMPTSNFANF